MRKTVVMPDNCTIVQLHNKSMSILKTQYAILKILIFNIENPANQLQCVQTNCVGLHRTSLLPGLVRKWDSELLHQETEVQLIDQLAADCC